MIKRKPTMMCSKCKKKTYIIFFSRAYEKLCDYCYDKIRNKSDWEIIKEKNGKYK